MSPGLGPDGLPSPGGYFPHNGSGNNGSLQAASASSGHATSFGGPSSSCNSNNPSPVTLMGAQNSHRSSPCNELLAAAMRTSATNGESSATHSIVHFKSSTELCSDIDSKDFQHSFISFCFFKVKKNARLIKKNECFYLVIQHSGGRNDKFVYQSD